MKTVGEILKKARIEKNISIEQLAAYTKINHKYLEAIESNQFEQLPAAAFTKGFLHTYATIVGIDPQQVLAFFRRDYDQDAKGKIIPRSILHPVRQAPKGITPNVLTLLIALVAGVFVIGFFAWQIAQFSSAPRLMLEEPVDNAVLISPITVRGTTDPLVTLTLNNRPILVDSSGNFAAQIQLSPGQHTLVLAAVGRSGKKTTFERIVYIQSAPSP